MEKKQYTAPVMKVVEFHVEHGFAGSGPFYLMLEPFEPNESVESFDDGGGWQLGNEYSSSTETMIGGGNWYLE